MSSLLQDLRYAIRHFLKAPGFAIGAILSLMLGIGATTAIFSFVYGVLLDPFPYKDASHIMSIQMLNDSGHYSPLLVNGSHLQDVRIVPATEDVLFQQPGSFKNLTSENSDTAVEAGVYSPNIFGFLGVPPLLGRVFNEADAQSGNPAPTAVLSYGFWREHYSGNREVIGKTIELDHAPYIVIGVMPPRFTWFQSDVYLQGKPTDDPQDYWMVFTRLKSGTDNRAAEAEIQGLVRRLAKEDPNLYGKNPRVKIATLNNELLGGSAATIAALFAAAAVLLIIGCANASILLLARGAARQHEFAVRTSLGAGRARLVRQLLTESLLLSVIGASLGVIAASWGVNAMHRMLPDDLLPHEIVVHLNFPVLLFSSVVAVIAGILFGLSPALMLSRSQPGSLLQASSSRIAGNRRSRTMHRLPIAGQIALTLLLLAGAGGAARTFLTKLNAPHGFDPDQVFSMSLELPHPAGTTKQERLQELINEQETVRQTVAQTPGVIDAAWSSTWRVGIFGFDRPIEIQGKPALTDATAVIGTISPQLLSVLRVPLLRGRIFSGAEVAAQAHLVLVNQTFVKQYLGDLDPIGQSVRAPFLKLWENHRLSSARSLDSWVEVIGVVGDATNDDLDHPRVRPAIFLPSSFGPHTALGQIYVRAGSNPDAAMRSASARLRKIYPGLVVSSAHTLRWELDNWGWGRERLIAVIIGLYGSIALVLAATGLYSVVSFAVKQRTHELGIRMALGAQGGAVVRLVLGSTASMAGIGIAAGLVICAMLGPLFSAWDGGGLAQPLTLLGATVILALVAAIACLLPALRASSIDPVQALRIE
jgi:predicted permease